MFRTTVQQMEGSTCGTVISSDAMLSENMRELGVSRPGNVKSMDEYSGLKNYLQSSSDGRGDQEINVSSRTLISYLTELCEELELFGVSQLINYKTASECNPEEAMKSVINSTFDMICLYRQALRQQDELEAKLKRIKDDNRALKSMNDHLKGDVEGKTLSIVKLEEELRQAKEKSKKTLAELKVQTDEIRQLKCKMKYTEKKNDHELRRKEQEISKLQSQLNHSLGLRPSNKNSTFGRDVKTQKQISGKEQKDAYQQLICKFETANKELLQENLAMNSAFQKLNKDLASLVARYTKFMYIDNAAAAAAAESTDEEEGAVEMLQATELPCWEECLSSTNKHIQSLATLAITFRNRQT